VLFIFGEHPHDGRVDDTLCRRCLSLSLLAVPEVLNCIEMSSDIIISLLIAQAFNQAAEDIEVFKKKRNNSVGHIDLAESYVVHKRLEGMAQLRNALEPKET